MISQDSPELTSVKQAENSATEERLSRLAAGEAKEGNQHKKKKLPSGDKQNLLLGREFFNLVHEAYHYSLWFKKEMDY